MTPRIRYDGGMKILFVAAEVAPYVTVGGLSQVMYFLPRALKKEGHDVRIFTARHGGMSKTSPDGEAWRFVTDTSDLRVRVVHENGTTQLDVEREALDAQAAKATLEYGGAAAAEGAEPAFSGEIPCLVSTISPGKDDAQAYFLENKEYFELRANVFGYADDHTRFALLAKACLEWLLVQHGRRAKGDRNAWWPDVIHCHDWHTSYLIDLARRDKRFRKILAGVPILLTVHNFKYQGNSDFKFVPEEERDTGLTPLAPLTAQTLQKQNALKRGLLFADAITTVSPTHAVEVFTPEYSEGLLDVLQRVRGRLSGILNGIDVNEFDPASDPIIHRRFHRLWYAGARAENKKHLQKTFSLPADPDVTLLAYVGRLTSQKGWDLLLQALPPLLEEREDVQFVTVGTGDEKYRNELAALQSKYPGRVGLHLQADFRLPRKVFSGADVVLVPSIFEPGGIVALEAMRYGAVPLVRRTGGLNDSVADFDPVEKDGNGFSFTHKNPWALYGAIIEAMTIRRQPSLWDKVVSNALASDFSWSHAAEEYEEWYGRAIQDRSRRNRRAGYPEEE